MIINYLVTALRNLRKYSLFAFINITSLAIGIAFCLVIYLFIVDERSFDDFHHKAENLYRLDEVQSFPGTNTQKVALSMPAMGPAMQNDYPEIINFTRFWGRGKILYQYGEQRLMIDKTVYVDSTFLTLFDFELISGNRKTALNLPYSVLITEETALKFFNSTDDAINKIFTIGDNNFTVRSILKNVPENSHLQFERLAERSSELT